MKKFITYILSFVVLSCSTQDDTSESLKEENENYPYQVDLYISTRTATLDSKNVGEVVSAEDWEKDVKSLIVYLYYPIDQTMTIREYSALDFKNQPLTLNLSSYPQGGVCECYAVANYKIPGITNNSSNVDLLAKMDEIGSYNGEYKNNDKPDGCRPDGFVMSAAKKCVLNPISKSISLSLDRIVAKVIFDVTIGDEFYNDNQGTLTLGKVSISNSAISTPLFANDTLYKLEMGNNIISQQIFKQPDYYTSLMYIYESPEVENIKEDGVLLALSGSYIPPLKDASDAEDVTYFIRIKGDEDTGKISRNKIYYVKGTIKTLGAADLDVEVHVLDWGKTIDQDYEYEQPGE